VLGGEKTAKKTCKKSVQDKQAVEFGNREQSPSGILWFEGWRQAGGFAEFWI
jgi:hypothetical protein